MNTRRIMVCGLPNSGKSTYLGALWDVLQPGGPPTVLSLTSRNYDDYAYVRSLHSRWQRGEIQARTRPGDVQSVGLDLSTIDGDAVTLEIPDLAGELFSNLWETRSCEESFAHLIHERLGIILFIHADEWVRPRHLIDDLVTEREIGEPRPPQPAQPFSPANSPCQVKLVDLLQLVSDMSSAPGGRLSIILSAWDKVADAGQTPESHLKEQLPLLDQYLRGGLHHWEVAIYGVSAQGTDYVSDLATTPNEALETILDLDHAYERVRVIAPNGSESHDLTQLIAWSAGIHP